VGEGGEDAFPVLEENRPVVEAFLVVQSQLTPRGFRYEGVEAGLRMAQRDCTPDVFEGLREMESAVIEYLNEHRDV